MVKLRLARAGAKKHPFYRVVVTDSRNPRDGRFIEQIGTYSPMKDPVEFQMKMDRVEYWLGVGAQTSESVKKLLMRYRKEAQAAS
jgi:small subunit ribosomal protein S16